MGALEGYNNNNVRMQDFLSCPLTSLLCRRSTCCACFRGERDGGIVGPTHERVAKRKAPKMKMTTTARRSPARRRRPRKRTIATKTTRSSGAERGGIVTEKDEARTPRHPQTTTYLRTTTPANIVVFQITRSWWVLTGSNNCTNVF